MMRQASWPCSLRLFAALAIVSAPAMIFADAGDEFRLLDVWRWQDAMWIDVMFKFQGSAPLHTSIENARGSIRERGDTISVTARAPAENMTVVIKLQDAFYRGVLNAKYTRKGRHDFRDSPSTCREHDNRLETTGCLLQSGSQRVTSGGVAGSGVVYDLSFKTYVKKDDEMIGDGGEDLLTVSDKTQQDDRAVFQVDLDTEDEPQGLAVVKASVEFQPDVSPVVRAIKVEKVMEFYSTESSSALDGGAFFKGRGRHNRKKKVCDLDRPKCVVSCTMFNRQPILDFRMEKEKPYSFRMIHLRAQNQTDFGIMSTLSFTMNDIRRDIAGNDFWCTGRVSRWGRTLDQVIEIDVKQRAHLQLTNNSAGLHPNQTLEVRCAAYGYPTPDITITADDDPSTSLWDRFPADSHPMWQEIGHKNHVRYMLSKPCFTSKLTHVTCTASNGFGAPVETVLHVVTVE